MPASLDGVIPESASARMEKVASEWYAQNPDVRRLWMYMAGNSAPGEAHDIHVIVALAPVGDSDDITPIWLARCNGWQRHLQTLIGSRVRLDWFDGDTETVPCTQGPDLSRTCLASVAWRE